MFGPRISRVFASRGHALWWSLMVLVTAYCVAIDPPATAPPGTAQVKHKSAKKSADPWAHLDDGSQIKADKKPEDTWSSLEDAAKKRQELLH